MIFKFFAIIQTEDNSNYIEQIESKNQERLIAQIINANGQPYNWEI